MNWYFEVQPISKVDTVPCGHQLWHEQPSVKQQWCPGQSRTLLSLPGGLLFWYPEPTEGCRDHQGFWGEDREVFYCRLLFSGGFSLIVSFRAGTNWSPDFACHSPFPSSHSLETDPLLQFFKPNGNLILTSLNKGGMRPRVPTNPRTREASSEDLLQERGDRLLSWETNCAETMDHVATNYYSNVKSMEEKPSNQTRCVKWKEIFMLQ